VRPPRRLVGILGLVALAAAGCMPQPATTQGQDMADLYRVFLIGGVVVAGIVWGLATFALIRYRGRRPELPPQDEGSLRIEAVWTIIPLITVLVLFGLTVVTLAAVNATSSDPGVNVKVTAFQWQWRFTYPDDGIVITGQIGAPPELVLPVGETVHVTVESLDVVHSFFVPGFLFKRDAVPGRPSTFDLVVKDAGVYPGQCAEFCGVFHDAMTFTVRAVDPATFRQWLSTTRATQGAAGG
jgi:cytochrome c oxidase subunit 2